MDSRRPRLDQRAELRSLGADFEAAVADLRADGSECAVDRGVSTSNLAILFPYYLIEGLPFDGDLAAARTMALGNAFGSAHFLIQDRHLDADEEPAPRGCRLSDRCLVLFTREYARLFPPDSGFWLRFDAYMDEYFESLEWERQVLWNAQGAGAVADDALQSTLRRLGQKMSPLKVTAAGVAHLAGAGDLLEHIERVVEEYHTAYQLADDLSDLPDDLAAGRWSVVAWMIARCAGFERPPSGLDREELYRLAVESGAFAAIADGIREHYDAALECAGGLSSPSLTSHLERLLNESSAVCEWTARRIRIILAASDGSSGVSSGDGGPAEAASPLASACPTSPGAAGTIPREPPRGIHFFTVGDEGFVFDGGSGLFFQTDRLALDVLRWLERGSPQADLDVLQMDHGGEALREVFREISLVGETDAAESAKRWGWPGVSGPSFSNIASLALNLTDGCNLSCDYCYLGSRTPAVGRSMSEEIALQAVDLLIDESFGERDMSIVFFGGEPLLRPELIERVVAYALDRAKPAGQRVTFHMTTNGTLLTPGVARSLHSLGVRVLVSIDGARSDHDRHRVFPDGSGSYDTIASNMAGLPRGMRVGARVTVTPESAALAEIVAHLTALGFSVVHLAPVSGPRMPSEFADRLCAEFEELAREELQRLTNGGRPRIGNFAESVLSLETGRRRLIPCGAGTRYLSVGPDGALFLCHRFAGSARYEVGHVSSGVDQAAIDEHLSRLRRDAAVCGDCWARYLCGGPCFHDLETRREDSVGEAATRCKLRRRVFELSMWLYASLPDEPRSRLAKAARRRARPEIASATDPRGV